jgi:hypothetical protein
LVAVDDSKRIVSSHIVVVPITWIEMKQIRIRRNNAAIPPALGEGVLAIVAVALLLVVAALAARKRPALGAVNVIDLTHRAVGRAVRVDLINLIERRPHVSVREDSVGINQLSQLGAQGFACENTSGRGDTFLALELSAKISRTSSPQINK